MCLLAHIQDLVQRMTEEEAAEREQREMERCTCRIKLFCQLPGQSQMVEKKLRVHKDSTLRETTKLAYKVNKNCSSMTLALLNNVLFCSQLMRLQCFYYTLLRFTVRTKLHILICIYMNALNFSFRSLALLNHVGF